MLKDLLKRAHNQCELCSRDNVLTAYMLGDTPDLLDESVLLCTTCLEQMNNPEAMNGHHWRCLSDSMWSEYIPVQVMAYRVLSLLKHEDWALDLRSQMYLGDDDLKLAQIGLPSEIEGEPHLDSNGSILNAGDNVTLIKDLVVKGANFTAKRGTMVRNITLTDNSDHIEGKVNGTRIVLVTKYLKKVND